MTILVKVDVTKVAITCLFVLDMMSTSDLLPGDRSSSAHLLDLDKWSKQYMLKLVQVIGFNLQGPKALLLNVFENSMVMQWCNLFTVQL